MIRIYNSKSKRLEEFQPIEENKVSMYVCGPTVYNYIHIGNARPLIFFDVVAKFFRHMGYEVTYLSNFTDVDDKIIQKAMEEGKTEREVSEFFIDAYLKDAASLNAGDEVSRPKVTEHMGEIISFIEKLVEKDMAYAVGGDVYFRVGKSKDYGQISGQKIEDLLVGARIDENSQKENPLDFTLWKKTEEGIQWDSPWGMGRPGWHTECVVMIDDAFHRAIDIHGGGMDLKFPHHENEVAQAHAACEHHLANYWMHNGFVNIDGEKMSKSLNNFVLTKDLVEQFGGDTIRLAMLQTHYRQPINFSHELLVDTSKLVERMKLAMKQASVALQVHPCNKEVDVDFMQFNEAMSDDFNTANAITGMIDDLKKLNASVRQKNQEEVAHYFKKLKQILYVLGVTFDDVKLTNDDLYLYNAWENARKDKNFDLADQLRKELVQNNIL